MSGGRGVQRDRQSGTYARAETVSEGEKNRESEEEERVKGKNDISVLFSLL